MPKVETARYKCDDMSVSVTISVNKQGEFSTTLPQDFVALLSSAGIEMAYNRVLRAGYLCDQTMKGLQKQIGDLIEEYMSREMTNEKLVIKYIIQTTCSYCLDPDRNIVPNGQERWTKTADYGWKNGTVDSHAADPHPFGISVYAKPFIRRDYKYKSGKTLTEYDFLNISTPPFVEEALETDKYLDWLNSTAAMTKPEGEETKEIDYTMKSAEFFVNLLSSICQLNEKIKDHLDPESLAKLINQGKNLLS